MFLVDDFCFFFSQSLNSGLYNRHTFCLRHYWLIRVHWAPESGWELVLDPCMIKVRGSLIFFSDLPYVVVNKRNLSSHYSVSVGALKCFEIVIFYIPSFWELCCFHWDHLIKGGCIRLRCNLNPLSLFGCFREKMPWISRIMSVDCASCGGWSIILNFWQLGDLVSYHQGGDIHYLDERFRQKNWPTKSDAMSLLS